MKGSIEKRLLVLKFLLATPQKCAIASSSWRLTRDVKKSWSNKLRVAWTQSDVKSTTCNCAACKKHVGAERGGGQTRGFYPNKKLSDNHTRWLTQFISPPSNTTVWNLAKLASHGHGQIFLLFWLIWFHSPFWKLKKGMICWLLRIIIITEKNVKKTPNLAAENNGCVPMVTNMAASPVLLLLWIGHKHEDWAHRSCWPGLQKPTLTSCWAEAKRQSQPFNL